jgi:hypothetical protein
VSKRNITPAALNSRNRNKSYPEYRQSERGGDFIKHEAFRHGYERGQKYLDERRQAMAGRSGASSTSGGSAGA